MSVQVLLYRRIGQMRGRRRNAQARHRSNAVRSCALGMVEAGSVPVQRADLHAGESALDAPVPLLGPPHASDLTIDTANQALARIDQIVGIAGLQILLPVARTRISPTACGCFSLR